MNSFQFIKLLRMLYGHSAIDLSEIQKMGLLAVKIGQMHALRIDFLDREKCEKLSELYRHAVSVPKENVLMKLDRSLFSEVASEPFASASVGQAYRARLHSGEEVVIKVIKQNFRENFIRDVISVRRFFRFAAFFYPPLHRVFNPLGILRHIEDYTLSELDLRNEVQGQNLLRSIYETHKENPNLALLRFPKIFTDFSNDQTMISEYIPGQTIDELLEKGTLEYQTLLEFFRIQGFYIFKIGTFHGDIHPGNVIVHKNFLYFIDTGAINHVAPEFSRNLFRFFNALVEYDYDACASHLMAMSEIEPNDTQKAAVRSGIKKLYANFKGRTVSEVSLSQQMMGTIKTAVLEGLRFPNAMFPVIKSFMFLDGMVLRCRPQADLIADMKPFIKEFAKELPLNDNHGK